MFPTVAFVGSVAFGLTVFEVHRDHLQVPGLLGGCGSKNR
jgi:hypothetical protein